MEADSFSFPSRRDTIALHKERYGRSVFGVFPAEYPREILWAMDILPVEIWDPPLPSREADAHLQPYICSIVRLGLELILKGECEDLDGFLFPHTCDSIQNLASIVTDYLDIHKPCYFFYHPKAPYTRSATGYYREQLRELVRKLERQAGPMAAGALEHRTAQSRRLAAKTAGLYALRARGELRADNRDFYRIIRLGEYLHPDDFLPLLERFSDAARGPSPAGMAVVMTGVLPSPPEILGLLDDLGVRIGEDDFLCCGRRLRSGPVDAADPFEALTRGYFRMPPCSTKDSPIAERLAFLEELVRRSGARGVIFHMVKFCEPERFDVPQLCAGLERKGIPALVIDSEAGRELGGQVRTRVEAFAEMIQP